MLKRRFWRPKKLYNFFRTSKTTFLRVLQNQVMMITTMMWVIIVIIILVLLMILVLKMTKKYHIIWYWCQNIRDIMVEKRVKKLGQGPPPFSGNALKKSIFLCDIFPNSKSLKASMHGDIVLYLNLRSWWFRISPAFDCGLFKEQMGADRCEIEEREHRVGIKFAKLKPCYVFFAPYLYNVLKCIYILIFFHTSAITF